MSTRNGRKRAENVNKNNIFGFDFVHETNSTNPRKRPIPTMFRSQKTNCPPLTFPVQKRHFDYKHNIFHQCWEVTIFADIFGLLFFIIILGYLYVPLNVV